MIAAERGLIVTFLVATFCLYGEAEGDRKGKALTQSDANAICSIVRKLRELRNNVTHNMKFGEKTAANSKKVAAHYTARAEAKKVLVDVLRKSLPEEDENLTEAEKLLIEMEESLMELTGSIKNMNASFWAMKLPSWKLLNMSDSYAYWVKDTVEAFSNAVLITGSCCLVVDGGETGDCVRGGKRGSVPTDCTTQPLQRAEGGLAEYENPLNTELSLTMGSSGNGVFSDYGCYITTTNDTYIKGRKSLIYELSGGLFNTSGNKLIANFTSVGKEFQDLIGPLNNSIRKISSGNTSITAQRATLDGLLLKLGEKIKNILKGRETTMELAERLGTMKDVPWYGNESDDNDGVVRFQQTLPGMALLLLLFLVFWK